MISELGQEKPKGMLAKLLESYEPPAETFEVVLPLGEVLTCRYIPDDLEFEDVKSEAIKFANDFERIGFPPPWQDVETHDREMLLKAYLISKVLVDCDLANNPFAVVALARKASCAYRAIVTQIEAYTLGLMRNGQLVRIDEEKKDLKTTDSEQSSPE